MTVRDGKDLNCKIFRLCTIDIKPMVYLKSFKVKLDIKKMRIEGDTDLVFNRLRLTIRKF